VRQLIRASLLNHTGNALLPTPPRPTIWPYGTVTLTQQASLLSQLPQLVPGDGTLSNLPLPMEEYGQQCALLRALLRAPARHQRVVDECAVLLALVLQSTCNLKEPCCPCLGRQCACCDLLDAL